MKRRLYFLPVFIIIVALLIVGTFNDLNISKTIVKLRNPFSIVFAALTTVPLGFALGFISGNLISYYIKYKPTLNKWWQKFLLILFIIVFACGSIFIVGTFSVSYHAFNLNKLFFVPIGLIILIPSLILGIKLFSKFDKPFYIKYLVFICIVSALPIGMVLVAKYIAPRVRYTTIDAINKLSYDGFSYFSKWYAPGLTKEKKDFIINLLGNNLEKEAFESFPSGHTTFAWAAIPMYCSLMVFNRKLVKYDSLFFFGGVFFVALVAFSRIFIGAHYLSDTMMASLIAIMVFYISYEIYLRKLKYGLEEEKYENNSH